MPGHPDHCVELQQSKRHCWIVQVYFAHFDLLHERLRQRVQIELKTQRQCCGWANTWPDPTELGSFDCFMKMQCIAPPGFISKGVEAKRFLPFPERSLRVVRN